MSPVKKEYFTRRQKWIDFFIGMGAFFGANLILQALFLAPMALLSNSSGTDFVNVLISAVSVVWLFLPWVLNLLALIWLLIYRKFMGLGWLAGIGLAFLLVIIAGVVMTAFCFYILSSYQNL
jgi:hypothetical protein